MFKLKCYQKRTLEVLRAYLEDARFRGSQAAFDDLETQGVAKPRPYRPLNELESTPFVCLRLPTGGGKTLLAAHTVKIAAEAYIERDWPLVLWLVPTNTIRKQTLETLTRAGHPNNEVLRTAFDGQVKILDIADFAQIRPQDLRSRACIVVGTLQTLRVNNTEGRKVYAHHEDLEPHFADLPDFVDGLETLSDDPGHIRYSFANLLARCRPLVIVDEAHNASSKLSYEVLRRIRAACVVEFTATPANDSNVLHNVSASELKAEAMIKLPIRLMEHNLWQEAVHDSLLTRQRLAEVAEGDADYIRPIVLFQAEKKNQDVTKDILLTYLVDQENIPRERIAVVTGDQRELDGIDLFDPACKIDVVITVEALKEGWDCSFAYVFCSVAAVRSARDVEQILGRVLRMPYAERRANEELNRAYAHVSRTTWPNAVNQLHDRLVDMGFERQEADAAIEPHPKFDTDAAQQLRPTQPDPLVLEVAEDLTDFAFPDAERDKVTVEPTETGTRITIAGEVSEETAGRLVEAIGDKAAREDVRRRVTVHRVAWARHLSPAQRGVAFRVPQLCLRLDGDLELAERELLLDIASWDLLDGSLYSPELQPNEFDLKQDNVQWEIDIQAGRLQERLVGRSEQLDLDLVDTGWTIGQLSRWLDGRLRQRDIRQPVLLEFLRRGVTHLVERRGIEIGALVRHRYVLAKVFAEKIVAYRMAAYDRGYQQALFAADAQVETSFEFDFEFQPDVYPARWFYDGSYSFGRHYYPLVGELKASGEEFECAKAIDMLPRVKHWVRNLQQRDGAFWLPLAGGRTYPDFVAELDDGRVFVVEYKGEDRSTNQNSREKQNVGELWEGKSQGRGLYLMPTKGRGRQSIEQQLTAKISSAT